MLIYSKPKSVVLVGNEMFFFVVCFFFKLENMLKDRINQKQNCYETLEISRNKLKKNPLDLKKKKEF